MRLPTTVPIWAKPIIRTVSRQHRRRLPEMTWQTTRKLYGTAGSNDGEKIFIRAGRSTLRTKVTLLHELAHWLTGEGHTHTYWLKAWELYRQFHIPVGYVLRIESMYKQGALTGYWASRSRRGRWPTILRVDVTTSVSTVPPD